MELVLFENDPTKRGLDESEASFPTVSDKWKLHSLCLALSVPGYRLERPKDSKDTFPFC